MQRLSTGVAILALLAASVLVAGCQRGEVRDRAEAVQPQEAAAEELFDADDRLGLSDAALKGNPSAPVTIVEFSSYQCPFCGRVQPTLNQIAEEFGDDVRFIFLHHPLPNQQQSRPAARAAIAAQAQDKFWEYSELILNNQQSLNEANFVAWAEQIGLDMDRFNEDRNADWTNERVDADLAVAQRFGIRGTPNFLINGRSVRGAQPFDNFASVIREEVEATRALMDDGMSVGAAFGARLDENLREGGAEPEAQQRPPQPDPAQQLQVPIGDSASKGGANALVTIVEFSSYQCPFCNRVRPTLDALQERYGDDLRIVFKHRPLDFQQQSEPAARAAIAAQNQGQFWEYHALLFDNQGQLGQGQPLFERLAEELGLNMDQFRTDMTSDATTARLRADTQLADRLQARGTPHFFINGYRLVGAQPEEGFRTIIDREIEVARGLVNEGTAPGAVYETLMARADTSVRMVGGDAPARPAEPAQPAQPVEFNTEGAPARGPADAAVTVVEFSDFNCGFCGRLSTTLNEVMPDYDDRVRFVSMQFPLGRWPISQTAAEAALAANAQGQFWEFKNLIYENQRSLNEGSFEQFAEQLGLNMDQFRRDMESNAHANTITAHRAQGQRAGVRGTPALFLNGRQIGGAIPADQLRSALDEALAN
ncbi:MAG: hypothetical protein EA398_06750 [Deltaproteobacteria bacterium]|nr:MAG: hypothetical protein EA398_06750 [Deltaproteobacteria bacterium]